MRRALLVLAALAGASGGCDVCGLIDQHVYVAPDDPDLGADLADCMNGVPPLGDPGCIPSSSVDSGGDETTGCACLPLCERLYAIINPNPNRPPLVGCAFDSSDGTWAGIEIEYQSTCQ